MEAPAKLGGSGITEEDLCCNLRCLYCCCVWVKVDFVDDFLQNLRPEGIYYPVLEVLNFDAEVVH